MQTSNDKFLSVHQFLLCRYQFINYIEPRCVFIVYFLFVI